MTRFIGDMLIAALAFGIAALLLAYDPTQSAGATIAPVPARVTVKHVRADTHQRNMIARVLVKCDRMGASRKVLIASVATITQESTARNLRGGDRDSVGLFQIRRMHVHGVDRRRVPEWSAAWFCSRAINVNHHRPHLTVAELSQAVQRSAHASAYGQWTHEARRTYLSWLA